MHLTDLGSGETGTPQTFDLGGRIRLMRDGLINNVNLGVSGLVGIFLVPIMLRGLGFEAYGLWVASLSVAAFIETFDLGLGWAVTREIGALPATQTWSETSRFVNAVGNVLLALGILGAILIAIVGLPLSSGLHLSPAGRKIAPVVFLCAGLGFLADRMLRFAVVVLQGLRRFDTASIISTAYTLGRAAGIITLIAAGAGLLAVALWHAVFAAAAAAVGLAVLGRVERRFDFRIRGFQWSTVSAHLPLSLMSQLCNVSGQIIWATSPVLIGLVLGSGWIATYHIAQKFPAAVLAAGWSLALALFPAAAQTRARAAGPAREVLEVGTRWILVLVLPVGLLLWVLAPSLLQAWVGQTAPDAVLVMRLVTAAVLVELLGAGSFVVLSAMGDVRVLFLIFGGVAAVSLGLSLALLPSIGIAGAAWGLLLPGVAGTGVILERACRKAGIRISHLMLRSFEGLAVPTLACGAVALAIQLLPVQGRWVGVVASSLAGGAAYTFALLFHGARPEERRLAREAGTLPVLLAVAAQEKVRRGIQRARVLVGKLR